YSQYEFVFYGMVSFVYSCVLILGISFVKIYTRGVSDVNYVDFSILLLFTLVGVLSNWKLPQSTIIISAGHFKETRARAIIEACLTISVSVPLVLYFGLKGVLIGSAIGLIFRSIDLFYAERITGFKFKYTLKRISRMICTILIAVIPLKLILSIETESLLIWLLYAILVSLWAGLV
ncbi:hypothetical protein BSO21_35975, partial [Paenibacillus odorifer]